MHSRENTLRVACPSLLRNDLIATPHPPSDSFECLPPFGSAKPPRHEAAYIDALHLTGLSPVQCILDVRDALNLLKVRPTG